MDEDAYRKSLSLMDSEWFTRHALTTLLVLSFRCRFLWCFCLHPGVVATVTVQSMDVDDDTTKVCLKQALLAFSIHRRRKILLMLATRTLDAPTCLKQFQVHTSCRRRGKDKILFQACFTTSHHYVMRERRICVIDRSHCAIDGSIVSASIGRLRSAIYG